MTICNFKWHCNSQQSVKKVESDFDSPFATVKNYKINIVSVDTELNTRHNSSFWVLLCQVTQLDQHILSSSIQTAPVTRLLTHQYVENDVSSNLAFIKNISFA